MGISKCRWLRGRGGDVTRYDWNWRAGGGAGNPGGSGLGGTNGSSGTGGLIVLIVKGNISIGSTGKIESTGTQGGNETSGYGMGGGGSGGGAILILHSGNYSSNGSLDVSGGAAGVGGHKLGGAGGEGSIQISKIK